MPTMQQDRRLLWFRRLARCGALLAACVVVLGAWVRLTDAGLGCPDWPGCYGHAFPQITHHFAQAVHEMVHRYFASTLSAIIVTLLAWAWVNRQDPEQPVKPVAALFLILCIQVTLGMKTVTLLLQPLIVTAHLLGGLTTLALLWWLSLTPGRQPLPAAEAGLLKYAVFAMVVLALQIALGGWTSSNYAAVACSDLPTCRQSWWPAMDYRDAFILWRGLGIDYEGGVLADPARVAIHVTHRLGAVIAGLTLVAVGLRVLSQSAGRHLRFVGGLLVFAVLLQFSIGVSMVHFGIPLVLATLHNAGAAFLVIVNVTLLRALRPVSGLSRPEVAPGVVPLQRVNPAR